MVQDDVTVTIHAEQVNVAAPPRLGATVAAGSPCREFPQRGLFDADQTRISPNHGLQPVLVRPMDRGRSRKAHLDPLPHAALDGSQLLWSKALAFADSDRGPEPRPACCSGCPR